MTKPIAAKLYDRMQKIMRWTVAAEDAILDGTDARKALRKVAKHSKKLAKLQALSYTDSTTTKEKTA